MTKDEIILANKEYLFPAVFHFFKEPLVVARAKDQYVWDADGKQYLDFLGGIVTVSVGQSEAPDGHAAARLHGVRQRAAGGAGKESGVTHSGRTTY
jgi:4-aminobutyrate aminotransferase-like enzyme